jgi:hypothetical protein
MHGLGIEGTSQRQAHDKYNGECNAAVGQKGDSPFMRAAATFNSLAELQNRIEAIVEKFVGSEPTTGAQAANQPSPMGILGALEMESNLAMSRIVQMHGMLNRLQRVLP